MAIPLACIGEFIMKRTQTAFLLATALSGCMMSNTALAQDSGKQIEAIQAQITQLQQDLKRIKSDLALRDHALKTAQTDAAVARETARKAVGQAQASAIQLQATTRQTQANQVAIASVSPPVGFRASGATVAAVAPEPSKPGQFHLGGVTVTLGGFLAAEGVYRTRNNVADIGSNFNTIPLGQSPNAHASEFRGTARQSRLSLLAEGQISSDQKIAGYYESDFLGVGTTSNSTESNSYTPRLRQAYLTYDDSAWGIHVLAGQAWSLLTMNKVGMTPRQENIPLTIDAQYVVGFNWKRQWQLRVDKDMFDHTLWLGASLEEPQTSFYTGPNGLGVASGTATITNPGGSQLNSTNNYSNDIAPDLVVKAAYDPGWGHYEAYGLGRLLHDRVSFTGGGHNTTTVAGGAGGGFIVPLIPKVLDFQASGLAGYGIGSYGSGQLPDGIVSPTGSPRPLAEYQVMAGLVAHPAPEFDLYTYVGTEQIARNSFNASGKSYGYGNPLYANGGCNVEATAAATCVGNTSGISQGTVGGWWRMLHGNYGTVQAGAQYSYTRRTIFQGAGTTAGSSTKPSADDNMVFFSVRYSPFQ